MKIESSIRVEYENIKEAKIAFESLNIDNEGFIESNIHDTEHNIINFNISSDSLSKFLATVDDLIFCEILVENLIESTNK